MRLLRTHPLPGRVRSALTVSLVGAALLLAGCAVGPGEMPRDWVATYSIVAADPETGACGVAVQSKFFSVGSVVPWAEAGAGAVATQALANTRLAPGLLDAMRQGAEVQAVLDGVLAADAGRARRQVGVVDARGVAAAYTGEECFPFAGHRVGQGYAVQGNLLAGPEVLEAMASTFEAERAVGSPLPLALMAALQAGEDAGGDRRGRQSAAMLVVRRGAGYSGTDDRWVDLRVEDHPDPTVELARLLKIHQEFFAERWQVP